MSKSKKHRDFLTVDLLRLNDEEFEEVATRLRSLQMKSEDNKMILLDYLNDIKEKRSRRKFKIIKIE